MSDWVRARKWQKERAQAGRVGFIHMQWTGTVSYSISQHGYACVCFSIWSCVTQKRGVCDNFDVNIASQKKAYRWYVAHTVCKHKLITECISESAYCIYIAFSICVAIGMRMAKVIVVCMVGLHAFALALNLWPPLKTFLQSWATFGCTHTATTTTTINSITSCSQKYRVASLDFCFAFSATFHT